MQVLDPRLWLVLVVSTQLSFVASGCGGDVCDDLLVEEQACSGFQKGTPPAGLTCTEARGVYAQCVLDSGFDLCKALVAGDAGAQKQLADKCGEPPK